MPAERDTAAQLWTDEGWVFASETGHPINPWTDWAQWKALLADAGVHELIWLDRPAAEPRRPEAN